MTAGKAQWARRFNRARFDLAYARRHAAAATAQLAELRAAFAAHRSSTLCLALAPRRHALERSGLDWSAHAELQLPALVRRTALAGRADATRRLLRKRRPLGALDASALRHALAIRRRERRAASWPPPPLAFQAPSLEPPPGRLGRPERPRYGGWISRRLPVPAAEQRCLAPSLPGPSCAGASPCDQQRVRHAGASQHVGVARKRSARQLREPSRPTARPFHVEPDAPRGEPGTQRPRPGAGVSGFRPYHRVTVGTPHHCLPSTVHRARGGRARPRRDACRQTSSIRPRGRHAPRAVLPAARSATGARRLNASAAAVRANGGEFARATKFLVCAVGCAARWRGWARRTMSFLFILFD